jgi:FkbM family methyltransferase
MNKTVRKVLQRARLKLADFGYDIRPVDKKCWEDQQRLLADRSVSVIIDAGANRGSVATVYRHLFPDARIICFEPVSEHLQVLKTTFLDDAKVESVQCALGAENGRRQFFVNVGKDTSSLLAPDVRNLNDSYADIIKIQTVIDVDVLTLDYIFLTKKLSMIDVLKMDVQGGELGILYGAKDLLANHRVAIIYTEVFFVPMYLEQPLFGDIAAELFSHGYKLYFLYNYCFSGRSGRLLYADAIFIAPEFWQQAIGVLSQCNRS